MCRAGSQLSQLVTSLFIGCETILFDVTKAAPAQAFAPTFELIFHIPPDTCSDKEKVAEAQRQAEALTPLLLPHELEDDTSNIAEDRVIYEHAQILGLPFVVL